MASRAKRTWSRGGGSSAIKAAAASILNLGFDVRAGGPRRNQANSLRSRLRRRAATAAAERLRSNRCSTYAAYPPSNASTEPS
jgi:hypothetical protein